MEANTTSSAKWVSRRTLDSQAHSRDRSAGAQRARGNTPNGGYDGVKKDKHAADGRNYSNLDPFALASSLQSNRGGSSAHRASSDHRIPPSNSSSSTGAWGSIAANSSTNSNKVNPHPHQGHRPSQQHSNGSGGRRGHGEGAEQQPAQQPPLQPPLPVTKTIPPPPRSVQRTQGTLPAHPTPPSLNMRDFIPQPRHARVQTPATAPTPTETTEAGIGGRRWTAAPTTPMPRSATTGQPPHVDLPTPSAVLQASPASPLIGTGSRAGAQSSPAPPMAAPIITAAGQPFFGTFASPPSVAVAPPAPRSHASSAERPTPASLPDALPLVDRLFTEEDAGMQACDIELLLDHVQRSTGPHDGVLGGGDVGGSLLLDRRAVADWGIEEAIRSVLPGMDEDDNADDAPAPNFFSGGVSAIAGSWHTSGEGELRKPVGAGFLADFPTSFAASFTDPTSAVLGSPFHADPAANTMGSLSRAFSTAARVDSSSFATSPATTYTATPLQRPPTSPGQHLPPYPVPEETVVMPPSTREAAPLPPLPASPQTTATAAVGAFLRPESSDIVAGIPRSPQGSTSSPWLTSGHDEGSGILLERGPARRTTETHPHTSAHLAHLAGLQCLPIKEGSITSNGLTASICASTPAGPPTRQSTATSIHGGNSVPSTPSIRREVTTPLSTTRSQATASGITRLLRPTLSAPVVNRHTIVQIFRETPQSLRRKEAMERAHDEKHEALWRDAQWPPHTDADVEQMLRDRGATKLLRHLTIISFSRQHVGGVQELFDTWAKNGIPAPDMAFGAYYYYVKEKSEKQLCMKHNGRGASPGHGYGRCDFESRRPYSTCRYEHVCLLCRSKEHGWFEEGKCQGYQQLLNEMEDLGITEEDVTTLLNAMEKPSKSSWLR